MRGALEHDRDLGDTSAKPLAGTQVKGHPGPAASSDVQADGGEGLGERLAVHAVFLEESDHFLAALPATCILAARGGVREIFRQVDGREHLLFLGAKILCGE